MGEGPKDLMKILGFLHMTVRINSINMGIIAHVDQERFMSNMFI